MKTLINYLILSSFLFFLKATEKSLVLAKFCTSSSKEKYKYSDNSPIKNIMEFMSNQPLAYWHTDRENNLDQSKENLSKFVNGCVNEEPVVVLYGLPGKDCDAGESSSGFNKNPQDYKKFLETTNSVLNNKQTTIIIEPDALALTVETGKCGNFKGYKENLKMSIDMLGINTNYKLYIDVGHWIVIYGDEKIKQMINFINDIDTNNKIKGFSLNLSNYRKTEEMTDACKNIRKISGKDYKCIIDTSRNFNGPSAAGTWCNYKNAGIGISGNDEKASRDSSVDAYAWIKPAAELDGNCYGNDESYQSNKGAGSFDESWLKILWDNGFYKNYQPQSNPSPQPQSNPSPQPQSNPSPQPQSNPSPQPQSNPSDFKQKIKICKATY
jgi:cellulase/cellobiase CelA1